MASEIRIHSAGYPEIVGELAGDDIEPTFRFTAGLRKQLAPAGGSRPCTEFAWLG